MGELLRYKQRVRDDLDAEDGESALVAAAAEVYWLVTLIVVIKLKKKVTSLRML